MQKIKRINQDSIARKLLFKQAELKKIRRSITDLHQAIVMKKIDKKKMVKMKFQIAKIKRTTQVWVHITESETKLALARIDVIIIIKLKSQQSKTILMIE